MKITVIAAATLLALSGCATQAPVKSSLVTNTVDYAYKKESGKAGIAQVFDLDGNTVVQMRSDASDDLAIIDALGVPVPFTKTGHYYVLKGKAHHFTVVSGRERATVSRSPKPAAAGSQNGYQGSPAPAAADPFAKHEYNIKTILASLPTENMTAMAADIEQRERYVKAIEYLQAQLDELKTALGMGKASHENTKHQRSQSHKMRQMKKQVAVKKAKADAVLAASPCVDPRASMTMDENTVAKMRADVARGVAPKTCLDVIKTDPQASASTQ